MSDTSTSENEKQEQVFTSNRNGHRFDRTDPQFGISEQWATTIRDGDDDQVATVYGPTLGAACDLAAKFTALPVLIAALRTARAYVQNELDQLDDDDAEAIEGTAGDLVNIDAALRKAGVTL